MNLYCYGEPGEWWIIDKDDEHVVEGYFTTKQACEKRKKELEKNE